jgi:hypothetical protein
MKTNTCRINDLNMTVMDMILAVAGGNPGAITVCLDLYKNSAAIDPDAALGGLANILGLDSSGIYEHRIWMLYKDVCQQNLVNMVGVLRANQLGYLTQKDLDKAIDGEAKIDVADLIRQVKEFLPAFGGETVPSTEAA